MRNLLIIASAIALTAACQKEDPRITEMLDLQKKMSKQLDDIAKQRPGAMAAGAQAPRRGADPNTVYNVPVEAGDVVRGAKVAKVTVVEGFDFACPFCAQSRPGLEQAAAKHPEDVRVVSKQFVVHPQVATLPALAVCAAQKQGKGSEMESAIWADSWADDNGRPKFDQTKLSQENIEKLATAQKLNVEKLKTDMKDKFCQDDIARQQKELSTVGVNGTPAFFINGKPYQGQRTADAFNAAIEDEIKKVDAAIKAGAKADSYYADIMKNAQKSL
jgi:protein-disulfide isomerase